MLGEVIVPSLGAHPTSAVQVVCCDSEPYISHTAHLQTQSCAALGQAFPIVRGYQKLQPKRADCYVCWLYLARCFFFNFCQTCLESFSTPRSNFPKADTRTRRRHFLPSRPCGQSNCPPFRLPCLGPGKFCLQAFLDGLRFVPTWASRRIWSGWTPVLVMVMVATSVVAAVMLMLIVARLFDSYRVARLLL